MEARGRKKLNRELLLLVKTLGVFRVYIEERARLEREEAIMK